jgi:pSer/pThr/pTyr-binding forkhead associated (FHA) protein
MKAKLVVINEQKVGMEIPISTPRFAIGWGEDCQFRVQSKRIDQRHCVFLVDDASCAVEDCGTAAGTFVNGQLIRERQALRHGDRIAIGPMELEIRLTAGSDGDKHLLGDAKDDNHATASGNSLNEVSILHWLEDGEDEGDPDNDERYWRRAAARAADLAMQESETDNHEARNRQGQNGFDGPGLDNSYGQRDALPGDATEGKPKKKKKPRSLPAKLFGLVLMVVGPIYGRWRALDRFERILFVTILTLALVVVMIMFPVTFVWFLKIINVRRWSHWVWTGIFSIALAYLFWLREQYE